MNAYKSSRAPLWTIGHIYALGAAGRYDEAERCRAEVAMTEEQRTVDISDLGALARVFECDFGETSRRMAMDENKRLVGVRRESHERQIRALDFQVGRLGLRIANGDKSAEEELAAVRLKQNPEVVFESVPSAVDRLLDGIANPLKHFPFGFPSIDNAMGGAAPKEVSIVGAATGVGKSAFLARALSAAIDRKDKVALISLEDDANQALLRIACSKARVTLLQAKRIHPVNHFEAEKLTYELEQISRVEFLLLLSPTAFGHGGATPEALRGAVLAAIEKGAELIFVDHATEVRAESDQQIWNTTIDLIGMLRDAADRHQVAMVVAAQMKLNESEPNNGSFAGGSGLIRMCRAGIVIYKKAFDKSNDRDDFRIYAKILKSTKGGADVEAELEMIHGGVLREKRQ